MSHSHSQGPAHDTDNELIRPCTPPQPSNDEHRAAMQATPLIMKSAGTDQFTSTHLYRDSRMANMAYEAQNHIVGPMPLGEFVDLFLPVTPGVKRNNIAKAKSKFNRELGKMASCGREDKMYCHFIGGVKLVCPNFPAVDTSQSCFPSFKDIQIKPDVTFFQKGFKDRKDITMVEMMVEFKFHDADDAFTSCTGNRFPDHIDKYTKVGKDTLGQITAYATAHKSSQFRTHLFSLLLFQKHGRILFWDCTGVVVTERFLLTDDYFIDFFVRYNKATQEQRGYDLTVKTLSKEERLKAERVFPKNANLFKLSVGSSEYVIERTQLWMGTGSPFGRSTRAFIAHLLLNTSVSKTPVFLKDTWRVVGRQKEDSVYTRLQEKGVPFVGTLVESGDISKQATKVQEIAANAEWGIGVPTELRKLQHFRLVLEEVASELTTFRSTKELVTVLYDALQAHKAAYENARILHRDISVGNILIGPDRRGLLVDWDLVKDRDDTSQSASERTGTWQFMAGRLLTPVPAGEAAPIPNLADDLESFVHVLTWVTFRYTPTTYEIEGLTNFIRTTFDDSFKVKGIFRASHIKNDHLKGRSTLEKLPDSLLKDLLYSLCEDMAVRYETKPSTVRSSDLGPDEIIFQKLHKKRYETRYRRLDSSDWMIGVFKHFLDEASWPVGDAAHENPLKKEEPDVTKKRSSEIWGDAMQGQKIEDGPSASKKLRLSGIPEKD